MTYKICDACKNEFPVFPSTINVRFHCNRLCEKAAKQKRYLLSKLNDNGRGLERQVSTETEIRKILSNHKNGKIKIDMAFEFLKEFLK